MCADAHTGGLISINSTVLREGKISEVTTGTGKSIKNGEYLPGRYVGNGELRYEVIRSAVNVMWK